MARGVNVAVEGLNLPELEKHGGKVHIHETLTAEEFLLILGSLNETGTDIAPDKWPDVIIQLARDEDGRRLFQKSHREKILKWDAADLVAVIQGIAPAFDSLAESLKKT